MIPALRAELRKLLTVRSTYIIVGLVLSLDIFVSFYGAGFRQHSSIMDPATTSDLVRGISPFFGLLISLIGLLLVTHEYRYNTITYSLTSSSYRLYVPFAKVVAITLLSVVLAAIICVATPLLLRLGLSVHGHSLIAQNFDVQAIYSRCILYIWGFSMFGLIIATIVRNQVGSFATLLLLSTFGEGLLSLVLKENSKYLPFMTLTSVLQDSSDYSNALTMLLVYLVGGLLVAAGMFYYRDAN